MIALLFALWVLLKDREKKHAELIQASQKAIPTAPPHSPSVSERLAELIRSRRQGQSPMRSTRSSDKTFSARSEDLSRRSSTVASPYRSVVRLAKIGRTVLVSITWGSQTLEDQGG